MGEYLTMKGVSRRVTYSKWRGGKYLLVTWHWEGLSPSLIHYSFIEVKVGSDHAALLIP
jgi:hypothetical protein